MADAFSSSSSSITNDGFTYDVFLSFRGCDTRYSLTGSLWKALDDKGIRTFFDKDDLSEGKEITPSLLQAIEQSRMALIVLSPNYASSTFCLEELSHILECIKGRGRLVWPIFYDVEPFELRWLQEGTYKEAMDAHENSPWHTKDIVQKWKNALHKVANLSGTCISFKHNRDGYLHEFIEKIVRKVSAQIKPFTLYVPENLVGLKPQMENVIMLLNLSSNDTVHMVEIHGIGGIGKTTLSSVVYNSIACQFEGSCFLPNIRENLEKHGLVYLQKMILSEIVGENDVNITSDKQGTQIMQQRLNHKKVLLVLDDVESLEKINAIVGRQEWFGLGSRVIITTRNTGMLARDWVKITHEMYGLNKKDALDLLRLKAFEPSSVGSSFDEDLSLLLERAIAISFGLPLALEVIGSRLLKIGIPEWENALIQYERIPDKDIQKVLEVSFETLQEEEKSVFLDIACCFKGYDFVMVEKILHAHRGDCAKRLIRELVEKSLIKKGVFDQMTLHDLIETMGREVVRRNAPEELGERSRLWHSKDIIEVLQQNRGTNKIEIIRLDSSVEVNWDGEAFKGMTKLRTLIIEYGCRLDKSPKYLPNSLRVLRWQQHPSVVLPLDFYPKQLAMCKLYVNALEDVFMKNLEKMKILDLANCHHLRKMPDISLLPNLEELSFQNCANLISIDDSVGLLGKLKILCASNCSMLKSFPPLKLPSLQELDISYCTNLVSFPSLKLPSLQELDISNCTNLVRFPPVVNGFFGKLKILRARSCHKLKSFPLLNLPSLKELDVSNCTQLESLPIMLDRLFVKLKILNVYRCSMLRWLSPLNSPLLRELNLSHCKSLESFPEILGEMGNIREFYLDSTPIKELPFSFRNFSELEDLSLHKCRIQLPSSIVLMPKLESIAIFRGEWLFPKHEEGEENVSPSPVVVSLILIQCNLSDESLVTGLKWFANVRELDLSGSKFTTLPECLESCLLLWKLVLTECEELQEIIGMPPRIKEVFAANCKSLNRLSKRKLLNQELHEAGNTRFYFPRAEVPEWFEHRCMHKQNFSFWFRNKIPAIIFCLVSSYFFRYAKVMINGTASTTYCIEEEHNRHYDWYQGNLHHLHLFHMPMEKLIGNLGESLLKSKWIHVEIVFKFSFDDGGIHVLKEKTNMRDIRFEKP